MTFKKTVALPSCFPAGVAENSVPFSEAASRNGKDPFTLQGQQKKSSWSFATKERRMQAEEGCGLWYDCLLPHAECTAAWLLSIWSMDAGVTNVLTCPELFCLSFCSDQYNANYSSFTFSNFSSVIRVGYQLLTVIVLLWESFVGFVPNDQTTYLENDV